jgi:UrcA family protein
MSNRLIPILAAAASLAVGAGVTFAQPGNAALSEPLAIDDVVVTPPGAPPGGEERREPVAFADLDLNTTAGAYTLMGRIKAAAQRVCSPDATNPDELGDTADHDSCMFEAVDRAVAVVDAPSLDDVYRHGREYARAYSYRRRSSGY